MGANGDKRQARCLSMFSGGLDSMLAVCLLRELGAHVEAVVFDSPFFNITEAKRGAAHIGVKLHVLDFFEDITGLVEDPPHGFGGNMNPCIDCHAQMVRRTGELMEELGFDCIITGEVLGQRPMSQNRIALDTVLNSSGYGDRLVRPFSAKLLPPTRVEEEGLLDRERLLGLSGRTRKPQMALAAAYGITEYPAPAGGCLLTDEGFCKRLSDLMAHEGFGERRLLQLLRVGRHMRLPGGTKCIIGRNREDNEAILAMAAVGDLVIEAVTERGPTLLLPGGAVESDDEKRAAEICVAYGAKTAAATVKVALRVNDSYRELEVTVKERDEFVGWLL